MLAFFYAVIPSYGVAIALLTVTVRIFLIPLTTKQVKSQQAMQRIQPELKRLQAKYKNDRQKLNEEMMKFYKENKVNPLAGCLPILLQAPLFIVLYRLILDLSHNDGPKHVPTSSKLFTSLVESGGEMVSWGIDLSKSASSVGGGKALPYYLLIAITVATGYFQQRQMTARLPKDAVNPQMQMIGKIFPAIIGVVSLSVPAGVVVYFIVSNLWQIGQQAIMFRAFPPVHLEGAGKGDKGDKGGAKPTRGDAKGKGGGAPGARGQGPPGGRQRAAGGGGRWPGRRSQQATPQNRGAKKPQPEGQASASVASAQGSARAGRKRARGDRRVRGPTVRNGTSAEELQKEGQLGVEWVEVTAKTVEEAKDEALDQLGVDESEAEFEVLEEPKAGLFGRLRSEARVRARVAPTAVRPKVERGSRRRGRKDRPRTARRRRRSRRGPRRRLPRWPPAAAPVAGGGRSANGGGARREPAEARPYPAARDVRSPHPTREKPCTTHDGPAGDAGEVGEEFLTRADLRLRGAGTVTRTCWTMATPSSWRSRATTSACSSAPGGHAVGHPGAHPDSGPAPGGRGPAPDRGRRGRLPEGPPGGAGAVHP